MTSRSVSAGRRRPARLGRLFSTDHRTIGLQYLALSTIAVIAGAVLSLLMRVHLVWPALHWPLHGPVQPEEYLAIVTLHGTLMLFFVLTVAPQSGFGNLILPAQIGARHMAFPLLNAWSVWITAGGLLCLLASPFVPAGAPISGWTAYPPLSAVAAAGPGQGFGMDLWCASISLFCLGGTLSAVNILVTVIRLRCDGMTWERLPLTVWAWFTAAVLSLIAFSVLLAAMLLLVCDRHAGTAFFVPAGDLVNGVVRTAGRHGNGSPLLWLHLFWFFGHPEVYIASLPGMGLTSMLLANFARRRVFAYRLMIATTLLIGLLGIVVWGHHMFVAGLNPWASSAFSLSTLAIALPSAAKVLSWLRILWRSETEFTTPCLFAIGFVSLFVLGGLTGPILAQPILDQYLHNTFFVVAHFHLIMAMAGVFGLFAATYYWFPLMAGRLLSERLGRLHFWCSLVGAYATFLPMHLTGLAGEPRHYAQLSDLPGTSANRLLAPVLPWNHAITAAAIFLGLSQLFFLFNLWRSWKGGEVASANPWQATTLEWEPPAALQPAETSIRVFREPCCYGWTNGRVTVHPQWEPSSPEIHSEE